MSPTPESLVVSPGAFAETFGITEITVQRWIEDGTIASVQPKAGGRVFIPRTEITRLLAQAEENAKQRREMARQRDEILAEQRRAMRPEPGKIQPDGIAYGRPEVEDPDFPAEVDEDGFPVSHRPAPAPVRLVTRKGRAKPGAALDDGDAIPSAGDDF